MEGDEIGGEKSLWVTYLLWWCFGWSGLHHFYLGRDNQAFVWWSTVGGYLFMGWVRDLWRIPYYVQEANMALKEKRTSEMNRAPIFNASRFLGQIVVGVWYGTLVHLAVPEESLPPFMIGAMSCIGIASGIYLVGSIGSETGPFYNAYFGALSWYVLSTLWGSESVSYSMCSAVASVVFNCSRRYKASHNKDKFSKRLSRMTGRMAIVFLLWSSYFTYNASLTLDNGEKVRLRDSINHFLKSPVWTDFKRTAWTIYEESRQKESWEYVFNDVYEAFDPTGEKHAMKVLEVNAQSSTGEIRRAYKKLAVKWHPDRHKAGEKEAASERFMEIQHAYEILSARKKSSRTRRDATRTEF